MIRMELLTLVMASTFATSVSAQSKSITIHWYELDCSKCEMVATKVATKENEIEILQNDDVLLIELKESATERSIAKHTQDLTTTGKSTHQTEIDGTKFRIDINVVSLNSDGYTLDLQADLTKPVQIEKPSGVGKIFAASQPQARERLSMSSRVVVAEAQGMVLASRMKTKKGVPIVRVFEVQIQNARTP